MCLNDKKRFRVFYFNRGYGSKLSLINLKFIFIQYLYFVLNVIAIEYRDNRNDSNHCRRAVGDVCAGQGKINLINKTIIIL